jgi:hypothetical protein
MIDTFHIDLERGFVIEKKALQLIRKKYPSASLIHKFKGYDIWIPETNQGIEIKYDPMSNKTGNLVVEIEFNKKDSALLTTTADYWMFYDDIKWIVIKPMQIVKCIFHNQLTWKNFQAIGDTKSKIAYLIKKDLLMQYSSKVIIELICP